jgi:hypothetical protein
MSKQMTGVDFRMPSDLETLKLLFPHVLDMKQTMSGPKNYTENSTNKAASHFQIAGNHYRRLKIQVWDYVIANDLDYFQGSIIKYVTRWKDKGGVEDLRKAKHFLDKYIETMEEKYKHLVERPE